MGDIGDYWREHKEYVAKKKLGKTKARSVEFECACGKKYYSIMDQNRMADHLKSKGEHSLIKGKIYTSEFLEIEL